MEIFVCNSLIVNKLRILFRAGGPARILGGKTEGERRISVDVFGNENVADAESGEVNKIGI